MVQTRDFALIPSILFYKRKKQLLLKGSPEFLIGLCRLDDQVIDEQSRTYNIDLSLPDLSPFSTYLLFAYSSHFLSTANSFGFSILLPLFQYYDSFFNITIPSFYIPMNLLRTIRSI